MTESKKLQTTLGMLNTLRPIGLDSDGRLLDGEHHIDNGKLASLIQDARLAHEMLPVIKQLVDAVEAFRDPRTKGVASPAENSFYAPTTQEGIALAHAIAAAAPFLQEEED